MSLTIRNGRLYKQHFVASIEGPKEGWIDCGEAPPISRFNRIVCLMNCIERGGCTDRWYYVELQRAAARELGSSR